MIVDWLHVALSFWFIWLLWFSVFCSNEQRNTTTGAYCGRRSVLATTVILE